MFNYVLVFALMNSITTVYSSYPSMKCYDDPKYRNDYDSYHNNIQFGTFIAGMKSYHYDGHEDRVFKWRYCTPKGVQPWPLDGFKSLSITDYDANWQRDCSSIHGGNSALIGALSWHNNGKEDRQWTFYCGILDGNLYFAPGACQWTNYVNDWDHPVNYDCPNNGFMRGISSYHHNGHEDRRWKFECCRVSQRTAYSAQTNQEMVDINDYVFGETSESQNRAFWIMAFISAGLCILCMIFGLYLYRRNKIMHKYSSNVYDQEEEMDEMEIKKLVM